MENGQQRGRHNFQCWQAVVLVRLRTREWKRKFISRRGAEAVRGRAKRRIGNLRSRMGNAADWKSAVPGRTSGDEGKMRVLTVCNALCYTLRGSYYTVTARPASRRERRHFQAWKEGEANDAQNQSNKNSEQAKSNPGIQKSRRRSAVLGFSRYHELFGRITTRATARGKKSQPGGYDPF